MTLKKENEDLRDVKSISKGANIMDIIENSGSPIYPSRQVTNTNYQAVITEEVQYGHDSNTKTVRSKDDLDHIMSDSKSVSIPAEDIKQFELEFFEK